MISTIEIWANAGAISAPDTIKINEGWIEGDQPPDEWLNWLFNQERTTINELVEKSNVYETEFSNAISYAGITPDFDPNTAPGDQLVAAIFNSAAIDTAGIKDGAVTDAKIDSVSLSKLTDGVTSITVGDDVLTLQTTSINFNDTNTQISAGLSNNGFSASNITANQNSLVSSVKTSFYSDSGSVESTLGNVGGMASLLLKDTVGQFELNAAPDSIKVENTDTTASIEITSTLILCDTTTANSRLTNGTLTFNNDNGIESQFSNRGVRFDGDNDPADDNGISYRHMLKEFTGAQTWQTWSAVTALGTEFMGYETTNASGHLATDLPTGTEIFSASMTYENSAGSKFNVPVQLFDFLDVSGSIGARVCFSGRYGSGIADLPVVGTERIHILYDGLGL